MENISNASIQGVEPIRQQQKESAIISVIGQCENLEIVYVKLLYGLPTKNKKYRAGIAFGDGGLYVFYSDSGFLYIGECRKFYNRLTPQHHRIHQVAPVADLKCLIISAKASDAVRKQAEVLLIETFKPLLNGAGAKVSAVNVGDALLWARETLSQCTNEGIRVLWKLSGEIEQSPIKVLGFRLEDYDETLTELFGIDTRNLNIDHDVIKIALQIVERLEGITVYRLDDTKIAIDREDFRSIFPRIEVTEERRITNFQRLKIFGDTDSSESDRWEAIA
jgi:hypothetical protein